jgi:hypothetical protein
VATPKPFSKRKIELKVPRGEMLMSADTAVEAQAVVNRLILAGFAAEEIAIVGRDLVTIEYVTGRLTYARVALRGALNGSWFGLFFGVMLSLGQQSGVSIALPAAVAIGAGVGMLIQLGFYAARKKRHDYSSIQQVVASRYEVIVPNGAKTRAEAALQSTKNA